MFIRDNELAYEAARSPDKDFIVIESATHWVFTPRECERPKESSSNSVKSLFDYAARWINERFRTLAEPLSHLLRSCQGPPAQLVAFS
jgi:hypothetical protein